MTRLPPGALSGPAEDDGNTETASGAAPWIGMMAEPRRPLWMAQIIAATRERAATQRVHHAVESAAVRRGAAMSRDAR
ncbi:hypothetical protein GCM10022206_75010 [Streptomyces chiangmaiensis]